MDPLKTFGEVVTAIRNQAADQEMLVNLTDKLSDLAMDSLDLVDVVNQLEMVTGVSVPSNRLGKLMGGTVGDLVTYLEENRK